MTKTPRVRLNAKLRARITRHYHDNVTRPQVEKLKERLLAARVSFLKAVEPSIPARLEPWIRRGHEFPGKMWISIGGESAGEPLILYAYWKVNAPFPEPMPVPTTSAEQPLLCSKKAQIKAARHLISTQEDTVTKANRLGAVQQHFSSVLRDTRYLHQLITIAPVIEDFLQQLLVEHSSLDTPSATFTQKEII